MKVYIIYFSQTGNTKKVAEAMVEALTERGHDAAAVPLKEAESEAINKCDLLGVGSPCFTSKAPGPVKEHLVKRMPSLNGKPAFVFATAAGAPGRVLHDLSGILKNKGARIIGGFLGHGENFHPAPCLQGRYAGRPNQGDLTRARQFAAAAALHVEKGFRGAITGNRPDKIRKRWGYFDLMSIISMDPLLRILLPEPGLIPERCRNCNWCVDECPGDNIVMKKRPVLLENCIRCYRCYNGCPNNAYKTNWLLGNLVILTLYNKLFESWFGNMSD